MKKYFLLAIAVLWIFPTLSQEKKSKIEWLTFEQAMQKNKSNPKKIFIDLYTGWCGWCKKMDASTFEDSKIAAYMNQHYYCVKLDAETKDTLTFKNKKYFYRSDFKANELAVYLLNGQMSYPTAVYLEDDLDIITPVAGYQTSDQLLPILTYFAEDIYLNKTWEQYRAGSK